ncbi:carboxypeptidase regulatory-like domain-containing protein [Halorientalis halophila]|uniref:carboxypeptidase regulatory-like domain-containing protein n=1 Tax=Halorientalis halophila TaxID=3108499 RepID=UPI003008232F
MQPAAATDVSTQTDGPEFDEATAEVTKTTLFTNKVSKVTVGFTAPEGETVDITVADKTETVTATGDHQDVTVRVGAYFFFGEHYPVDVSASIEGGETVEGTLNEGDGEITLKEPDTDPAPPNLDVSGLSTNSPVTEGETLTVDATVTNNGEEAGTQTVELDVAGGVQDSTEVSLDAGASTDVSLTWTTASGDAGDYTATVSSDNDSETAAVTVNEPVTTGTIAGTVTDAGGSAIEGATVTADGQSTTTAADGSYSLTVEAGDYTVDANADGFNPSSQTVTVNAEETTTADFSLEAQVTDGTVEGTVTDAGGSAIEGATVSAGGQSTTTAADGSYSLTLTEGDYSVEANADGFNPSSQSVTVTAGETTTADFALEAQVTDGTIAGTVTDAGGSAIEGATVSAGGQSTTTAADGSYSLTLTEGDYTVEASADGFQSDSQSVTVTAGETTTADFALDAVVTEGDIAGTVTDADGSAIEGATVTAGGQSTTTAADGSYTLTLEEGDYTVEANADGYVADSQTVTVTAGETTTADFALEAEGPTYQSFTAYTEDGYIDVGTDENAGYGEIPECPNGELQDTANFSSCVKFNASFDQSTGDYTVAPEDFTFPVIDFSSNTLGPVPTNNTASDTITGSLDTSTGESTFNAPIFAELQLGTDGCGIPVNVAGTTGQSGALTGSPADPATFDANGTAEATLVDNELEVPATEGCGILGGTIDDDVGLPAPSGENEVVLELYIEFHEEPLN